MIAAMSLSAQPAMAEPEKEQLVKAAILYNLARFSTWPAVDDAKADGKFRICIFASDYMATPLKSLIGNKIQDLEIDILEFDNFSPISPDCHLFFLSEENSKNQDLSVFSELGVLTVGESKKFLEQGGGITIRRYGPKLGFSINRTVMEKINVIPSSKILNLSAGGQ